MDRYCDKCHKYTIGWFTQIMMHGLAHDVQRGICGCAVSGEGPVGAQGPTEQTPYCGCQSGGACAACQATCVPGPSNGYQGIGSQGVRCSCRSYDADATPNAYKEAQAEGERLRRRDGDNRVAPDLSFGDEFMRIVDNVEKYRSYLYTKLDDSIRACESVKSDDEGLDQMIEAVKRLRATPLTSANAFGDAVNKITEQFYQIIDKFGPKEDKPDDDTSPVTGGSGITIKPTSTGYTITCTVDGCSCGYAGGRDYNYVPGTGTELKQFVPNEEIEFVLDTMVSEATTYNDSIFAMPPLDTIITIPPTTYPPITITTIEENFTVQVYLDDGRVYEYEVASAEKVREHADAIVKGGYRHNDGKVFEHYPPHRISKVGCSKPIPTNYPDRVRGT